MKYIYFLILITILIGCSIHEEQKAQKITIKDINNLVEGQDDEISINISELDSSLINTLRHILNLEDHEELLLDKLIIYKGDPKYYDIERSFSPIQHVHDLGENDEIDWVYEGGHCKCEKGTCDDNIFPEYYESEPCENNAAWVLVESKHIVSSGTEIDSTGQVAHNYKKMKRKWVCLNYGELNTTNCCDQQYTVFTYEHSQAWNFQTGEVYDPTVYYVNVNEHFVANDTIKDEMYETIFYPPSACVYFLPGFYSDPGKSFRIVSKEYD